MKTYQDLLAVGKDETARMDFIREVITDHTGSETYKTAMIADEYDRRQNSTIKQYQKLLYRVTGEAVPDNFSANYKIPSNFFNRFIVQENQTLLANGVTFKGKDTKAKLGEDFDTKVALAGKYALSAGVCFAYFNMDHIEVFPIYSSILPNFAPLPDEESGDYSAGVRFWQLAPDKPLRATLYEIDGITDYIWRKSNPGVVLKKKRTYKVRAVGDAKDKEDGTLEYIGENYPTFPIVPFWGNPHRQSEIVGMREGIDCYDLIKSGFANTVDEASYIYWTLQNAGGMDDMDLAEFVQHMKVVKAAVVRQDGAKAESHTIEAPYQSRGSLLERLEKDLYRDAMAVNTDQIAAGNVTATQINAAYDALNSKVDQYELCVIDFIQGILAVAGLNDTPTFTRSRIANEAEAVQNVVMAAPYLTDEYITRKLLEIFGDGDLADSMIKEMDAENVARLKEMERELAEREAAAAGSENPEEGEDEANDT